MCRVFAHRHGMRVSFEETPGTTTTSTTTSTTSTTSTTTTTTLAPTTSTAPQQVIEVTTTTAPTAVLGAQIERVVQPQLALTGAKSTPGDLGPLVPTRRRVMIMR